jgi:hypothetical protein
MDGMVAAGRCAVLSPRHRCVSFLFTAGRITGASARSYAHLLVSLTAGARQPS